MLTPSATSSAVLSLAVSALSYLFLYAAASALPLFDKSPLLVPVSRFLRPILRWDSFHFFHIAQSGYLYEHEWAFFPGAPALMRHLTPGGLPLMLLLAVIACDSSRTLYLLSLHHLRSRFLAYITVVISLLSSSPVTVRLVPYSEPFFTYLSYKGMFYCTRKKWVLATSLFTLASTFRSNGFLLSSYILWGMVMHPILTRRQVALTTLGTALLLASIPFVPFIYHNYTAYIVFCGSATDGFPSWCTRLFPSIYTYSQSRYWNVGFLRYWSFSQLPNFIIAAPLFFIMANYTIAYLRYHFLVTSKGHTTIDRALEPFYDVSLLPYLFHSATLFLMLFLNAHTQIVLRLAPSVPVTYWSAARLITGWHVWGRRWVGWSAVWGTISIILWASFLPPA
ncbi:hypothetical protein AX15_004683 [Amanita polypyramis BW_CC]|nr:hypothetical protein AX15_004683 [Amanita polypyramis BW_CC]